MSDYLGLGGVSLAPSTLPEIEVPEIVVILPPDEDEPDEEQVSFLKWLIIQIRDWLVEQIIRPAIVGATWLIDWIRAELRYWTYEAIKAITDLTETTEGLTVTIALVIAAAILLPQLAEKIATSSVGMLIAKMVDWTKEKIGNILETIHFVDLMSIHEALLVLWPTWREIFTPFQDAISALAEQLGQGSGYIHAWLSVGHGLSMVGTSLLNLDPEIGELRAMEKSQNFMEKLDTKFRDYAHDPGLIARDVVEEFYIPYAEEIRDTHTATIEAIAEGRERTLEINDSLVSLNKDFDNLITATLPEFRLQMADNLKGIQEALSNYSNWLETYVIPGFDQSIRILKERADYIEAANEVARAKLANPLEIFRATEFQDKDTQIATYNYLAQMVGEGALRSYEALGKGLAPVEEGLLTAVEATFVSAPSLAPEAREALAYELPGLPIKPLSAGWFQGEY